jgi:predicted RNase H-like HicB family nuclease
MMRSGNNISTKGMAMKSLFVRAEWDEDACVWVATSDDVPGLATEAETTEALMAKLKVMIPELMEANGYSDGEEISFELFSRRFETARRLHA